MRSAGESSLRVRQPASVQVQRNSLGSPALQTRNHLHNPELLSNTDIKRFPVNRSIRRKSQYSPESIFQRFSMSASAQATSQPAAGRTIHWLSVESPSMPVQSHTAPGNLHAFPAASAAIRSLPCTKLSPVTDSHFRSPNSSDRHQCSTRGRSLEVHKIACFPRVVTQLPALNTHNPSEFSHRTEELPPIPPDQSRPTNPESSPTTIGSKPSLSNRPYRPFPPDTRPAQRHDKTQLTKGRAVVPRPRVKNNIQKTPLKKSLTSHLSFVTTPTRPLKVARSVPRPRVPSKRSRASRPLTKQHSNRRRRLAPSAHKFTCQYAGGSGNCCSVSEADSQMV